MRKLTVTRARSSFGNDVKAKLYIPEPEGGTDIFGTPCAKLGEVAAGETFECEISEDAVCIYAAPSEELLDVSCELCELPAGDTDEAIGIFAAKNAAGKAEFHFTGVRQTPAMVKMHAERLEAARKAAIPLKKKKKRIMILIVCVLALAALWRVVTAFLPKDRDFVLEELTITLNDRFEIARRQSDDYLFIGSEDVFVEIYRFPFKEWWLDGMTLESIINAIRKDYKELYYLYNMGDPVVKDGYAVLEYKYHFVDPLYDETYYYFDHFFKGKTAVWQVRFGVKTDEAEARRGDVEKWARSVRFKKAS